MMKSIRTISLFSVVFVKIEPPVDITVFYHVKFVIDGIELCHAVPRSLSLSRSGL